MRVPVAALSATDEIKALELARSRLETLLAGDENWRALTVPIADDPRPSAAMARPARNNRLEMALAGNELYQAWKHLNDAITVLRAKRGGTGARVEAAPGEKREPPETPRQVAAKAAAQAADALSRIPPSLMRRLETVQPPPPAAASAAPPAQLDAKRPKPERKPPAAIPEPEEATVTFVVRASSDHRPPAAEPAEAGPAHEAAPSQSPGRVGDTLEGEAFSPAEHSGVEAEVTIHSPEGLRAQREAEERANIVRRFRKALSGD
jgi:hypothetical protein